MAAKRKRRRRSPWGIGLVAGGGVATLTGVVLLWRGWKKYQDCMADPLANEAMCKVRISGPDIAGTIMTPLGLAAMTVGGAILLMQGKGG